YVTVTAVTRGATTTVTYTGTATFGANDYVTGEGFTGVASLNQILTPIKVNSINTGTHTFVLAVDTSGDTAWTSGGHIGLPSRFSHIDFERPVAVSGILDDDGNPLTPLNLIDMAYRMGRNMARAVSAEDALATIDFFMSDTESRYDHVNVTTTVKTFLPQD